MEKDTILLIEYTTDTGAKYADMLAISELAITPEWLQRITAVTIPTTPPTIHTGKAAIEYLKTIAAPLDYSDTPEQNALAKQGVTPLLS